MTRTVLFLSAAACTADSLAPADPIERTPNDPTDPEPPIAVDADGDGWSVDVDCNDGDETVWPGAPDVCGDDRVTDCGRTSDDGLVTVDGTATFDDLSPALEAAVAGSEVRVCAGIWRGPFEATVPIRLVAHGDASTTILDGLAIGTTLSVTGGTEVVGFTIRGGFTSTEGGGVHLTDAGTLRLEGCVVATNAARFGGGIAAGEDGVLTLVDTVVEHNTADDSGGGVFVGARSVLDLSAGASVSANHSDAWAGGVFLDRGSLIGGTITDNATAVGGGGVLVIDGTVVGTVLTTNHSGGGGGGITVAGDVLLEDTLIAENTAVYGGGLNTEADSEDDASNVLTIAGGSIEGNEADREGGGLYVFWDVTIEHGIVADNTARIGGGWYVGAGLATMVDGTLARNEATGHGGGVILDGGSFAAVNVDVDDNTPGDVFTGGVEVGGYGAGATFSCDGTGCTPAP